MQSHCYRAQNAEDAVLPIGHHDAHSPARAALSGFILHAELTQCCDHRASLLISSVRIRVNTWILNLSLNSEPFQALFFKPAELRHPSSVRIS